LFYAHRPCSINDENNPPEQRGEQGTNWKNPRGPAGGSGASPNQKGRQ